MQSRRRNIKKGLNHEEGRRRRENFIVKLRKNKREEGLMKRRAMLSDAQKKADSHQISILPSDLDTKNIPAYVEAVRSSEEQRVHEGVHCIRKLLSREKAPPVVEILQSGVLPDLVRLLTNSNEKIVFESAWAITNIASTDYTIEVVKANCIPIIVNLTRHSNSDIRDQCIWCLGNVAGDGPKLRDVLLDTQDCLNNLLLNIQNPASESLLRNAVWALSNFCRGKPQVNLDKIRPALPALQWLVREKSDPELLSDSCWALSYLSDGDDARIQAVVNLDVLPKLFELCKDKDGMALVPALRTVGNIVTGADHLTQAVINHGFIALFESLLSHGRRTIRREVCWALSNICAGTKDQVRAALARPDMIRSVIRLVASDEFVVRKEAVWTISNITCTASPTDVVRLFEMDVISSLCSLLDVHDSAIVEVALEAIGGLLKIGTEYDRDVVSAIEECGGVDKLEELQDHNDPKIFDTVTKMLQRYFEVEEEEDEEDGGVEVHDENTMGVGKLGGDAENHFMALGSAGGDAGKKGPFMFGDAPQNHVAFGASANGSAGNSGFDFSSTAFA